MPLYEEAEANKPKVSIHLSDKDECYYIEADLGKCHYCTKEDRAFNPRM